MIPLNFYVKAEVFDIIWPSVTALLYFFVLRRVVHYQSTGSLHSDSPSSTSVSPVPTSPSPTHTPPPPPPPLGIRCTPSPSTPQPPQRPSSVVYNSGTLHKRWSSTGDFNNSGITSPTATLVVSNSVAVASRSVAIIWQVMFLVLVQYVIEGPETVRKVYFWKTWSNVEAVFIRVFICFCTFVLFDLELWTVHS